MAISRNKVFICVAAMIIVLSVVACKRKQEATSTSDLPDLSAQTRPYVTTEATKVRTGPGSQFRVIGEIGPNAKIQAVGRDGEWLLIVSKKGNAPGYIEAGAVKPATGEEKEAASVTEGKYEVLVDTQVRSGPGLSHSVVANIPKGIKINVVGEENGWLKVESKQGNPPGYVEASLAKPVAKP
ncbi:MAG: SH3 domain-containing protein [Alphaproteobacteria bacterium]